jgi:hypothetical protein
MGRLKDKVIEILEIADSLSVDFDICDYADFTREDIEYIAMEAQVDEQFVCEALNIDITTLEAIND